MTQYADVCVMDQRIIVLPLWRAPVGFYRVSTPAVVVSLHEGPSAVGRAVRATWATEAEEPRELGHVLRWFARGDAFNPLEHLPF